MSKYGKIRNTIQLAASMRQNPEMEKALREDPGKVLDEINANRFLPNTKVYQMVVFSLGAAVLVALCGAIAISLKDATTEIPDILVATTSAAVGALAGLLAPQPSDDA
jgi:hypothetical protein